ncbi:MAG: hypothetical protein M1835_005681 [Candelina submexicana]|nr:MAG: hypothetical protein M1835_005681 [Candelina submexicana]
MTSTRERSIKRLSSLFSLGGGSSEPKLQIPQSVSASRSPTRSQSPVGRRLSRSPIQNAPNSQLLSPHLTPGHPSPIVPPVIPEAGSATSLAPPSPLGESGASRHFSPTRSRPGSRLGSPSRSRPGSSLGNSRQASPVRATTPTTDPKAKRRSWLSTRSRRESHDPGPIHHTRAWIAGDESRVDGRIEYDLSPLERGEKIPELWDDDGDTFVYLFPKNAGRGPSFKIDSSIYASSAALRFLGHGGNLSQHRRNISGDGIRRSLESATHELSLDTPLSPPLTPRLDATGSDGSDGSRNTDDSIEEMPQQEKHLYVPVSLSPDSRVASSVSGEAHFSPEDIETLVAVRNVFAFLLGQSLIATKKHSSIFSIFLRVANLLRSFEFSNLDGSTFGEVAATSFGHYVEELKIADVRKSREKTIEAIVLGERMRCQELYNEAFVHGVGKYEELLKLNNPKFNSISSTTRNRMERASMDLILRLKGLRTRLDDFEFPSLFAGIANSTTSSESKIIRFKAWSSAFRQLRRHTMGYYKAQYGSWPPKASSKKNAFEESGLNRLVLKDLYQDFADLYDLLVDRTALTTRSADMPSQDQEEPSDPAEPTSRALRRILAEYDHSSPPVQPPIPFDTPNLPNLSPKRRDFHGAGGAYTMREAKERTRRLKDDEVNSVLTASYNADADIHNSPFITAFKIFEQRAAHGKSVDELTDLRNGQWIFLYAVIQSLPMVVVDAPGVRWSQGVEYFLCEPTKGNLPWVKDDVAGVKKSWYGIAGGTGVVSLPSDVVNHGVEGIYRRSHCWEVAERWSEAAGLLRVSSSEALPPEEDLSRMSTLSPPPSLLAPPRQASRSPNGSHTRNRNSVHLGLEALPLPSGVAPSSLGLARPGSMSGPDPTKSFEDIIGPRPTSQQGKKKK